jgi:hypothetical protein
VQGQIWIVVNIANFAYWSIIFYQNIDVWIKESNNKARIFLGRNYMQLLYVTGVFCGKYLAKYVDDYMIFVDEWYYRKCTRS